MSSQKLVTEFHYQDGDVGVHPADRPEKDLWRGFSPISHPCHIVIRPDTPEGQERLIAQAAHDVTVRDNLSAGLMDKVNADWRAYKRYGYVPICVTLVTDQPRIERIPSPRFVGKPPVP